MRPFTPESVWCTLGTRLHFYLMSLLIQVWPGNCSLMSSLGILILLQIESDLFISGECSVLVIVYDGINKYYLKF